MVKNKLNIIHSAYIIFTVIYIFFAHLSVFSKTFNINVVFFGVSAGYLLYCLISNFKKMVINKFELLIVLYIIYIFVSSIILSYNSEGLEYMVFLTVIYIITINLKYNTYWSAKFINLVEFCTVIHCIFIILHAVFPSAILSLDRSILTNDVYETVQYATGNNYYSGISAGPASAGLFATILIGIVTSEFITGKEKKEKLVFLFIIGVLALIFSKKRAFVVAVIASILMIILLCEKVKNNNKKIVEKLFIFVVLILIVIAALGVMPQTQIIIDRFFNNDRMLSGRETMYDDMMKWFNDNKLFGVGLGQAEAAFGYGGHNIYLQMLAECGIIGSIIYFIYLLGIYIQNINIVKKYKLIDVRIMFSIFIATTLFLYGLTGNPIYDYSYLVFFMYSLAIPSSIKKERKIDEKG